MTRSAPRRSTADGANGANGANAANATNGSLNAANAALRALPSVEQLRGALEQTLRQSETSNSPGAIATSHATLVRAARAALDSARARILSGQPALDHATLLRLARETLARQALPQLRHVINATGVVINTNLGRAPLSERAITQLVAVARGYSNLEYDLDAGERGSRQRHTRALLRNLTGSEEALVVNNNAAATLVALAALAAGREVVIARSELVEIGGGFRVPDVMAQSGARLVEVGTTNRVRLSDYATAISEATALLLVVHPSNFRIIGFTETPALAELAALAHARGVALMHDLGSGALTATERFGLGHEPTVAESVRAGADVICFSGDKLLGGPQAGVIIGRHEPLARIERHPLMRATRIDKLTLAALEATLRAYSDETFTEELPVWRAIAATHEALAARAARLAEGLRQAGISAEVSTGESTIGGGSLPGETLPTPLCALPADPTATTAQPLDLERLAAALRAGEPPIIARTLRGQALFDLRAVAPAEDDALLAGITAAWRAVSPGEDAERG